METEVQTTREDATVKNLIVEMRAQKTVADMFARILFSPLSKDDVESLAHAGFSEAAKGNEGSLYDALRRICLLYTSKGFRRLSITAMNT